MPSEPVNDRIEAVLERWFSGRQGHVPAAQIPGPAVPSTLEPNGAEDGARCGTHDVAQADSIIPTDHPTGALS